MQSHSTDTHLKPSALYISPYDKKNSAVVNVDLDLSDVTEDAALADLAANIKLRKLNLNVFKLVWILLIVTLPSIFSKI